MASFEARHLGEIAKLIKKEKIDCDFVLTRATDVCLHEKGSREIEAKLKRLEDAGIEGLDDVFHCSEKKAEGVSGSDSTQPASHR